MARRKYFDSNPYVKKAQAFLKEDGEDLFVIAHMELSNITHIEKEKLNYRVRENPAFLHNKKLDTKPIRLAGWQEGQSTRVLYHAENPNQAKGVLGMLLKGKGYIFNDFFPVQFELVEEPLPKELEEMALKTIKQYRDTRPAYFHKPA